jgi:long-subunit fatty acid transport protein
MKPTFSFSQCLMWILLFLFFITFFPANIVFAQSLQRIEVPSSMNPVGSGARALGMGGAFIAVADDATAASWNPGGLIQLETPEVSVVGAYFQRNEDLTFGTNPEADGGQDVVNGNLNYLSAAYPFTAFNRNMIVSVNYQHLFDFTRQWAFPLTHTEPNFVLDRDIDIEQEGSLSAIGIAYCMQWTPSISFGITLNLWQDGLYDNKWQAETIQSGSGEYVGSDVIFEGKGKDEYLFNGFNANLGLLWHINSQLTLGLVIKTPFTADLTHKSSYEMEIVRTDDDAVISFGSSSDETDEELDMPMSYGVGLAYRFSDTLTTSLDIYRTEWGDYILTDSEGNKISPITGESADEANVKPTHQVRAGVEYLYIKDTYVIPFRGGIFYDPAPTDRNPDDFYGLSLGGGIAIGKFIFDMAYQYRFGNNVNTYILESNDFSEDVQEHSVYTSLIYHF